MDRFEQECRSYTQYLIGQDPSAYVIDKYRDFSQKTEMSGVLKPDRFDQFLVDMSLRGTFWARLADSYASRFRKASVLRKKLIATLAILECAWPACQAVDIVDAGGPLVTILRLGVGAGLYALHVLVALVIFTPARLAFALSARPRAAAVLER